MNEQPNITTVGDELAIRNMTARFADAVNRNAPDDFRALWAVEGTWDIGPPMNVLAKGQEAILSAFTGLMANWEFFVQMPHAGVIDVRGDRATARWTMNEIGRPKGHPDKGHFNISSYTDELIKRDGQWLFTARVYRFRYLDESPLSGIVVTMLKENDA